MIHCNNCKKKFYLINENSELEGKIVQCKHCNEKWLYESKTKYLENRLTALNIDLDNAESKINLRKKECQEKITKLEEDLDLKKNEFELQKILQDKVSVFENRLKETEKLNSEELELNDKVVKVKKQIRTTTENISSYNKDIEEKTNYIESRISSYNKDTTEDELLNRNTSNDTNSEVVNITRHINPSNENNKNYLEDDKEKKRNRFFSPNFIK
ncbi:hypothetical protein OAS64_02345 [Candidatus Pelagibacter sp.]|nr:hypothetical protein [Candidatus Pelagibacter sp.]